MLTIGAHVPVGRGDGPIDILPWQPEPVLDLTVAGLDGSVRTVADWLHYSDTDAFVVVHQGQVAAEWYVPHTCPEQPHAIMSITKSLVGALAGILIASGELDADQPATHYLPQLASGGYAAATVRDLLDMRTGGDYREDQPGGELDWIIAALDPSQSTAGINQLVVDSPRQALHAGPFSYRSLDTEALGLVLGAITGQRLQDSLEDLLLRHLGLEQPGSMTIDRFGAAHQAGGLALCARDLARVGLMLLHSGAVGDTQVVPASFIKDTRLGGEDSVAAFRERLRDVPDAPTGAHSIYRNQFWVPARGERALLCVGVHGQLMYIDPDNDTVVVKLSHWANPRSPELFTLGLTCATMVASHLGGIPVIRAPQHLY